MPSNHPIRNLLDKIYLYSGYLGAVFLVMIFVFVFMQMVARWSGSILVGAPDFTGYCMAASAFLALPYALNAGTHIRVNLFLNTLGHYRKYGEIWCWIIAAILTSIWAYYGVKMTMGSYKWNEISQGQDAWPLWIPQLSMAIGTIILALACIDNLISIIFFGKDNIEHIGEIQE